MDIVLDVIGIICCSLLPVVPALEKYARAAFKDGINSDRRYYNTTHYFFQQHFSSRRESRHRRIARAPRDLTI